MSASDQGGPASRFRLELLIEIPAAIIMFLMMFYITANAVLRTWWNSPVPNSIELVQYWFLPIVALLGFVAAQAKAEHITTDLVYKLLPSVAQRVVLVFGFAIAALVALGFAWFGAIEAMYSYDIRRTAGVSTIPSWPVYFLVPLAFGVLAVQWGQASIKAALGREPDAGIRVEPDSELASHGEPKVK